MQLSSLVRPASTGSEMHLFAAVGSGTPSVGINLRLEGHVPHQYITWGIPTGKYPLFRIYSLLYGQDTQDSWAIRTKSNLIQDDSTKF